jgi:pimeloyl-ACP methyl ester carboxylesterase
LQTPILKNDAKSADYEPLMNDVPTRIDASIRHLAKQGAKRIAVVAHSMGARMASYYLSHKKIYQEAQSELPIVVYVSIGMGSDDKNYLGNIKIPVFDIYGENDLPAVVDSVSDRMKASILNKVYKQIKVSKANHFFDDQNDELVKVVIESIKAY